MSLIETNNWHCVTDFCHIIPNEPGCYAIYIFNYETGTQELIYIGTARNLKIRLAKHEVRKVLNALISFPLLPMIKCKVMNDKHKRLKTEQWLIDRLQPKANYV